MWECKIGCCLLLQARQALGVLDPEAHEVLRSHRSSEYPINDGNCVNILFLFILLVLIDFQPDCIDGSLLMILLCWCGPLHQMISMPFQHCGEKL